MNIFYPFFKMLMENVSDKLMRDVLETAVIFFNECNDFGVKKVSFVCIKGSVDKSWYYSIDYFLESIKGGIEKSSNTEAGHFYSIGTIVPYGSITVHAFAFHFVKSWLYHSQVIPESNLQFSNNREIIDIINKAITNYTKIPCKDVGNIIYNHYRKNAIKSLFREKLDKYTKLCDEYLDLSRRYFERDNSVSNKSLDESQYNLLRFINFPAYFVLSEDVSYEELLKNLQF